MKLNFNLNKNGNNQAIFAVIRHNGDLKRKYTGFAIPNNKIKGKVAGWDYKKQRVVGLQDAVIINRKLCDWQDLYDDYIDNCKRKGLEIKTEDLLSILGGVSATVTTARYLTDGFQLYMNDKTISLQESTIKRYQVMKHQVEQYEGFIGKKVLLEDINKDLYRNFAEYLIAEHDNINKTIRRKIKSIRTICTHAVEEGILKSLAFMQKLDLKDVDTNRVPLNEPERLAFLNYRTSNLLHRRVIDAFITSMYVGLRYSDLEQIAAVHISSFKGHDGPQYYLNMAAEKTITRGSTPVPEHVYDLLKPYMKTNGPLFNLPANAQANEILKATAKELKLDRPIEWKAMQGNRKLTDVRPLHETISFHFGRYTYTHLLDTCGLQPTWIQQNMGHGKFATTEGYLQSDHLKRITETNERLKIAK